MAEAFVYQRCASLGQDAASPSVNGVRRKGNNGSRTPNWKHNYYHTETHPPVTRGGSNTCLSLFNLCADKVHKIKTHDHIHHMNLLSWPLWPNLLVSYSRISILTLLTILISILDRNKEWKKFHSSLKAHTFTCIYLISHSHTNQTEKTLNLLLS